MGKGKNLFAAACFAYCQSISRHLRHKKFSPSEEAATAFLAGEINCELASDTPHLTQELETLLKAFGGSLFPYADEREPSDDLSRQLEQNTAACSVGYAFLPLKGSIILTERYTFPTLRDFLYVELGRAILYGNAPQAVPLMRRLVSAQAGRPGHLL